MSDPIDLDALDALAEAATSRPWEDSGAGIDGGPHLGTQVVALGEHGSGYMTYEALHLDDADCAFIVAVANAYDAMSAELRQARAALAAAHMEIEHLRGEGRESDAHRRMVAEWQTTR